MFSLFVLVSVSNCVGLIFLLIRFLLISLIKLISFLLSSFYNFCLILYYFVVVLWFVQF